MQVNKSLLKKCLAAICCICLTLACVFGVAACGGETTVKNVTASGSKITVELTDGTKQEYTLDGVVSAKEENGVIKVIYADGTTDEISTGKVSEIKTSIKEDGKTYITLKFADGTEKAVALEKVVAKVEKKNGNAIEVTYTDGSKETLDFATDTCEAHEFGNEAVVKPASCQEEGLSIRVCKNCGYVESVIIDKDSNVHGKWVFDATVTPGTLVRHENANGIITFERADEGKTHYVLKTNYVYGSMTTLEDYSGMAETCFTAKCADCNEIFEEGHAPVEQWVNVTFDDDTVNVCEHEHTVVKTCPDCKSVFLYDDGSFAYNGKTGEEANELVTERESALGHTYTVTGTPVRLTDTTYKMHLHCDRCGKDIYPVATKTAEKFATCREGGFKTFTYSYENFVDGERTTITATVDLEQTARTTDHTVGLKADGTTPLQFKALNLATGLPTYEFNPDVKPFVDNGTIKWSEGKPANCSTHMAAVFTCTVCEEKIVISLSGEHTYGEEHVVNKTCTTDGYSYKVCSACGNEYRYNIVAATGHVYSYVAGSFDEAAMTAQFRCACGDIQTKPVTLKDDVPAADCRSKSYKTYKVTLDNGIGGTQEIVFKIESSTETLFHTIKAGMRKFAAYNIASSTPKYDHNDDLKALFANGTIRWSEGIPANCSTHMPAVFTCTVCNEQIVIALSGEHLNLDQSDKHDVAPTCTERGYVEVKCTDCGNYIEQSATDAKGHNFAPETASWNAFLALTARNGAAVTFKCADCVETITLYAAETVLADVRNGCTTTHTKQYDFYTNVANKTKYTYTVKTAEETDKTITFTYSWNDVSTTGSHLIGKYNNSDVTAVAFQMADPSQNKYDWTPAIAHFFGNSTLRWNEGKPGTCSAYALAVFKCDTCKEQVVIQVSGEHNFDTNKAVAASVPATGVAAAPAAVPTCTVGTRTWMHCSVCDRWVEDTTKAEAALGHNIPTDGWNVVGPFFAEATYDSVTNTVKLEESTLQVGYAEGSCTRCGDTYRVDVKKTGNRKTGWKIAKSEMPNCAKGGYILVEYYYEIGGVSTKVAEQKIEIAKFTDHITSFVNATHYVKAYDKVTGEFIITYYCEGCKQFVVYARGTEAEINNIIKTELGITNVNNSRA